MTSRHVIVYCKRHPPPAVVRELERGCPSGKRNGTHYARFSERERAGMAGFFGFGAFSTPVGQLIGKLFCQRVIVYAVQ